MRFKGKIDMYMSICINQLQKITKNMVTVNVLEGVWVVGAQGRRLILNLRIYLCKYYLSENKYIID